MINICKSTDTDRQLVRRILRELGTSVKNFNPDLVDEAVSMVKKKYNINKK